MCLKETHQEEQPAPLLMLQGNIFGGRYHSLRWQLWHARLQLLLSSQLSPSRSEPFHPVPLSEPGQAAATHPHRHRGGQVIVPWTKAVPSLRNTPLLRQTNQHKPWIAATQHFCGRKVEHERKTNLEHPLGWEQLGECSPAPTFCQGGHCLPKSSSYSHLLWDEDAHL